mmetsp:Transcript_28448/g.53313  ORF Transcript_28448/g.53313 Transcript_28448/m.53313 type:complete len:80 (-) Transcript_28448:40-279(-)
MNFKNRVTDSYAVSRSQNVLVNSRAIHLRPILAKVSQSPIRNNAVALGHKRVASNHNIVSAASTYRDRAVREVDSTAHP